MKLVTAAIIINNGHILLTRRKSGQKLEGYWEFPGGKIEDGETVQSCLERELFEELGVITKAGSIIAESIYEYEHGVIKLIGIVTTLLEENITLSVHDKALWVPIKDIDKYKLSPADIPIAKKIQELKSNV